MAIASARLQLGDLGTWIGSVAVAISLILLTINAIQLRRQSGRQIQAARERQAHLISAWIDFAQATGGAPMLVLTVNNASSAAIRQVRGYVFETDKSVARAAFLPIDVIPPTTTVESRLSASNLPGVLRLVMTFIDEAGVRWRKYGDSALEEITSST